MLDAALTELEAAHSRVESKSQAASHSYEHRHLRQSLITQIQNLEADLLAEKARVTLAQAILQLFVSQSNKKDEKKMKEQLELSLLHLQTSHAYFEQLEKELNRNNGIGFKKLRNVSIFSFSHHHGIGHLHSGLDIIYKSKKMDQKNNNKKNSWFIDSIDIQNIIPNTLSKSLHSFNEQVSIAEKGYGLIAFDRGCCFKLHESVAKYLSKNVVPQDNNSNNSNNSNNNNNNNKMENILDMVYQRSQELSKSVQVCVEYGNIVKQEQRMSFRVFAWTIFFRDAKIASSDKNGKKISALKDVASSLVIDLHPSFVRPHVEKKEFPAEISGSGYKFYILFQYILFLFFCIFVFLYFVFVDN